MKLSSFKNTLSLIGIIVLFFSITGNAQDDTPARPVLQDALPPAPNAASLGKFADIPVGLYTGTPQINIPIHQVKSRDLSLDISLSYHASGVKVEEVPSWVGLGWALNAGGVVTRASRGLPDDDLNGLFNVAPVPPEYEDTPELREIFIRYANGSQDSQPDLFYFNFAGYSGKAFIKKEGAKYTTHVVPYQKLLAVPKFTEGKISSWEFTAENGTKYTFDKTEQSETYTYCNGAYQSNPLFPFNSSWFLSEIESVKGAKIEFIYQDYQLSEHQQSNSETKYFFLGSSGEADVKAKDSYCNTYMILRKGKRLQKILYANGEIEFVPGNERCDLLGDNRLKEILIKDKAPTPKVLKKWILKHKYLNGSQLMSVERACESEPEYDKRLALVEINESDLGEKTSKPPYEFSYILKNSTNQGLPPRVRKNWTGPSLFFAQDHWGYFNGEVRNNTLVPEMFATNDYGKVFHVKGANRRTDESSVKVGTLNKIIYPTGGSTTFEYELHDCLTNQLPKDIALKNVMVSFPIGVMAGGPLESEEFTVSSADPPEGQTQKGAYTTIRNLHLGLENGKHLNDIALVPIAGESFIFTTSGIKEEYLDDEYVVFIPNGKYKIIYWGTPPSVPTEENNFTDLTARIELEIGEIVEGENRKVGGLRVKKVTDYDPVNNQEKVKIYEYKNPDGTSSGSIVNGISYGYILTEIIKAPARPGYPELWYDNYLWARTATPNIPLTSTQGSSVGYNRVSIYYGENITTGEVGLFGKTEYTYYSPKEKPDYRPDFKVRFPFAPADSRDWQRGLLREVKHFKREGGIYVPVKSTSNEYVFHQYETDPNYADILGLKVGVDRRAYPESPNTKFRFEYFQTRTGYYKPKFSTESHFDAAGVPIFSTRTDFEFGTNHLQPTKTIQTVNDGNDKVRKIITERTYPADYSEVDSGPLFDMQSDDYHIHNAVVEQLVKKEVDGIEKTLRGQIIEYGYFDADNSLGTNILPKKVYRLETVKPLEASELASSKPSFSINSKYFKPELAYDFDRNGNLQQQHQLSLTNPDDVINPSSLVWGLNNTLPVAQATNTTVEKIAYKGFEEGESNSWILSGTAQLETTEIKTGLRSRKFSTGASLRTKMPAHSNNYVVSFWAKAESSVGKITINGGAVLEVPPSWTYHQQEVNLATEGEIKLIISGANTYLDEVRIHPKEATMKTFSYNPIGTVNSITDENGIPAYYQHDTLQRLQFISDQDQNILQSFKYNYQVR